MRPSRVRVLIGALIAASLIQIAGAAPVAAAGPQLTCSWRDSFTRPTSMAFANNGLVYVVEAGSLDASYNVVVPGRVQAFVPCNNNPVLAWDNQGNGGFKHSEGIAIFGDKVYVADTFNHRIEVFDLNGNWLSEWGGFGFPPGIAVDSSGYVYTVDVDPDQVQKFDPSGNLVETWGGVEGSGTCEFFNAQKLVVDSLGNIFVADFENNRIVKIVQGVPNGCTTFATASYPLGITVDASGNVFVSEYFDSRIAMYDSGGTLVTSWPTQDNPDGMAFDSGNNLYVASWGTFAVSVFSFPNSIPPSLPPQPTPPGAPTGVTATPGNGQADVSWTAPSSDGGSAITGYTATSSPGNLTCSTAGLSCTVTGLANGTTYTFSVTATNGVGPGPASAPSNSVTPEGPATVPGAPTGVTATPGEAQAHVSWTAPSDGGSAITGYTATSSPGNMTCSTTGHNCTVTGLTDGTLYTFTVTATNAVGPGPASAPSNGVTPGSVDTTGPVVSAPTGVLYAPQTLGTTARLRLTWPAATDPSGIASYKLQSRKGTGSWITRALTSPTATSVDVALVPSKQYAFRLRATDGAGNVGAWVTTAANTLNLLQETAPAVTYGGAWTLAALTGASGGQVRYASTSTATASLTFTGSSVALVSTLAKARGMADIWLDGVQVATVDFYATPNHKKAIVWASPLLTPGSHTLEIRVLGTKNAAATSTRVDVDAALVWP